MYKGTLWLDYDDSEEEAHFEAELSLAKKGDTISFSFSGNKSDDAHPFSGKCISKLQNKEYIGEGSFSYQGETETKSIVRFTVEEDDKEYQTSTNLSGRIDSLNITLLGGCCLI